MIRQRKGNELHPVYDRYRSILGRCNDEKHPSYSNYGARGILLDSALMPFTAFRDYVTSLPSYSELDAKSKKVTLDRIDPNVGYTVGNLRWVSSSVQIANTRYSGKGSNRYTGVNWDKVHNCWKARISFEGKTIFTKSCSSEKDAFDARVKFIKTNNLPHFVQEWLG